MEDLEKKIEPKEEDRENKNKKPIEENLEKKIEIKKNKTIIETPKKETKVKKPLSLEAIFWKKRLEQLKINPVEFLERYPGHKHKLIINEIIDFYGK